MLSKRLEELRTEKGISKKKMAEYLRIDQTTYGKYECEFILVLTFGSFL